MSILRRTECGWRSQVTTLKTILNVTTHAKLRDLYVK